MSSGHRLPGFVELAELGAGAQGEVVLARHESGGGPVAIKYLAAGLLGDTAARNTFRDEAQMLKRVVNPHVARLLEYLESPWGAAIILEAVAGRPLRKVLDEHDGPLTPEAALTALKGSLLGLAAAHAVGVVHRDYKPANVLVQDNGQSKLIDFGIAVLTGQGGNQGTPTYMAPEQWAGEPATPATDLYAATCVFVECISGEKPFRATTLSELKAEHTNTPPPLERVPEPLRPLVERGMAKSPPDRIWNAYEFVSELETIAARTYGPDWEQRGLIALGTIAATVATTIPLAILGGTLLAPGAAGTTAGTAASGITAPGAIGSTHGAATADFMTMTGTSTSKGFLSKLGGKKGITGIGGVGVGAVIVGWFFWPSGPGVGGESQGRVHASFTRPGVLLGQPGMPASDSPTWDTELRVSPSRVRPGTDMQVVVHDNVRGTRGALYSPEGKLRCYGQNGTPPKGISGFSFGVGKPWDPDQRGDGLSVPEKTPLLFYPSPPAKNTEAPKGINPIKLQLNTRIIDESSVYSNQMCAFLDKTTRVGILTFPANKTVPPGRYLLTLLERFQVWGLREETLISPDEAGAVLDVRLPVIEVLDD